MRRCDVCTCSDNDACADSCSWVTTPDGKDICSTCDRIVKAIMLYGGIARRFRPRALMDRVAIVRRRVASGLDAHLDTKR